MKNLSGLMVAVICDSYMIKERSEGRAAKEKVEKGKGEEEGKEKGERKYKGVILARSI